MGHTTHTKNQLNKQNRKADREKNKNAWVPPALPPPALPPPISKLFTLKDARASETLFSINSSVILRDGCSLNTEFISAIFAALRRASAFVGQNWVGGERMRACAHVLWERGRAAGGRHLDTTDESVVFSHSGALLWNGWGVWKHNFDSTSWSH